MQDSIGGNNPLGTFTFSGYATESPADQAATNAGSTKQASSGAGFADFLLGLPQQTQIQAGLNKIYLRDNVYGLVCAGRLSRDGNVTLNYGLRYEYFAPLHREEQPAGEPDHNADFTASGLRDAGWDGVNTAQVWR